MIEIISKEAIQESLVGETRQYLVGNLTRPQKLRHFDSRDLEVGISSYGSHTSEAPHFHTKATEFHFMLSGWTRYKDLDTGEEFDFKKGDFYVISPGTKYVQKSKAGAEILFIKVPSINDKQAIEVTQDIRGWMDDHLRTRRTDYDAGPDSPPANSIKPAAAVAVIDGESILMVQRADSGKWTLPGGTLDLGESLPDCAIREMQEETGLHVEITDILGTYTNPDVKIAYSDGEVRQEFTVVFLARADCREITIDHESLSYRWIPMEELGLVDMTSSQRKRIEDLITYEATGHKRIG